MQHRLPKRGACSEGSKGSMEEIGSRLKERELFKRNDDREWSDDHNDVTRAELLVR